MHCVLHDVSHSDIDLIFRHSVQLLLMYSLVQLVTFLFNDWMVDQIHQVIFELASLLSSLFYLLRYWEIWLYTLCPWKEKHKRRHKNIFYRAFTNFISEYCHLYTSISCSLNVLFTTHVSNLVHSKAKCMVLASIQE